MTFKIGRVIMIPDYGLRCDECDVTDTGFSYAEDAGAYVHQHNVEIHGSKCSVEGHKHRILSKKDKDAAIRNVGGKAPKEIGK